MRTSLLLNSYHEITPTKILHMPPQSNSEKEYFNPETVLIRELRELSISLYLLDRHYPKTTELEFETQHSDCWANLIGKIEQLYEFLTENNIEIKLIEKSPESKVNFQTTFGLQDFHLNDRSICLFSGGADSTAGIVETIKTGLQPVMHHCLTGNRVFGRVKKLHSEIPLTNSHVFLTDMRHVKRVGDSYLRGFIFIVNSFILANQLGIKKIVFPENGPLMLNPAMSLAKNDPTKNSHPFLISTLENVFKKLSTDDFSINCIFKDKTKSEVMAPLISNKLIDKTNSCFIIQGEKNMCGNCFACFVRRFSLSALGYFEPCAYSSDPFLASCRLTPDNETMQDLHDSAIFLFDVLSDRNPIEQYLYKVPENFFSDPNLLFKNFAGDMFLGFQKYFELQKNKELSALGRFVKGMVDVVDKDFLSHRESQLAKSIAKNTM